MGYIQGGLFFVQTIHEPQGEKRQHFAKCQENMRKDVERCFGVLQVKFQVIANCSRQWNREVIANVLITCVVFQNMIIENEASENLKLTWQEHDLVQFRRGFTFQTFMHGTNAIENVDSRYRLRFDLIEHLWAMKGNRLL
jgi:hypothetical protein